MYFHDYIEVCASFSTRVSYFLRISRFLPRNWLAVFLGRQGTHGCNDHLWDFSRNRLIVVMGRQAAHRIFETFGVLLNCDMIDILDIFSSFC